MPHQYLLLVYACIVITMHISNSVITSLHPFHLWVLAQGLTDVGVMFNHVVVPVRKGFVSDLRVTRDDVDAVVELVVSMAE